MIGVYRSHTMTTSNGSPSPIDSCGSTRMPPKHRNGSRIRRHDPDVQERIAGLARGHVREDRPHRPRTSNRPNRIAGDVSGAANNATRGLPAPGPGPASALRSCLSSLPRFAAIRLWWHRTTPARLQVNRRGAAPPEGLVSDGRRRRQPNERPGRHRPGEGSALPAGAIEALRGSVLGAVLAPADPGYDDARAVWNAMIDRRPAVIVRCRGPADVIAAVAFAREHGLPASVPGRRPQRRGPCRRRRPA